MDAGDGIRVGSRRGAAVLIVGGDFLYKQLPTIRIARVGTMIFEKGPEIRQKPKIK